MSLTKHKSMMLAVCALLITAIACTDSERSAYVSMGAEGWPYGLEVTIEPDSADSVARPCDVAVAVRHTNSYEYSNIWVELSYSPSADTVVADTFEIKLADDYGRWHGKGVGVGFQHADTLLRSEPMLLSRPVKLRHVMRADTLAGIEQAGIFIM